MVRVYNVSDTEFLSVSVDESAGRTDTDQRIPLEPMGASLLARLGKEENRFPWATEVQKRREVHGYELYYSPLIFFKLPTALVALEALFSGCSRGLQNMIERERGRRTSRLIALPSSSGRRKRFKGNQPHPYSSDLINVFLRSDDHTKSKHCQLVDDVKPVAIKENVV